MSDTAAPVVDNDAAPVEPVVVNKNWYDDLSPDLKDNPGIQKFKTKDDLAKSYVELQKTLGKNKVVVPTDKSTPEEWKAFYKAAGAPEKDEEYDISMDELPEQARTPAEVLAGLRKAALDNGVTKKQFDAMFGTYKQISNTRLNQEVERLSNLKADAETNLRQEWGAAYGAKVDGAQKVINTFFKGQEIPPEFSILANSKGFIKAMASIADKLGEDVIAGKARVTMTPAEAQSEYNSILGDPKHPYRNELHPEHDAAVTRMIELQQMMLAGG